MFEFIHLVLLLGFAYVIFTIFFKILLSTENVLVFITILLAFYIIFRYVMHQTKTIFKPDDLPITTDQDLQKYDLEAGVELRELVEQENFQSANEEDLFS